MTAEQLAAAMHIKIGRAALWAAHLTEAMDAYQIDTWRRQTAFLAQIGHESGGLAYTSEIWGPTPAQARYEGRLDLGNTQPGDGSKYRGHGLIQVTGRANHIRVRNRLHDRYPSVPDFEAEPEALTQPRWAALSAADYWDDKGLNELADNNQFQLITRKINGGLNGQVDRLARLEWATEALA